VIYTTIVLDDVSNWQPITYSVQYSGGIDVLIICLTVRRGCGEILSAERINPREDQRWTNE